MVCSLRRENWADMRRLLLGVGWVVLFLFVQPFAFVRNTQMSSYFVAFSKRLAVTSKVIGKSILFQSRLIMCKSNDVDGHLPI